MLLNLFQNTTRFLVMRDHWTFGIVQSRTFETQKLWNFDATKSRYLETNNLTTKKTRNWETTKPSNQDTKKPRAQETKKLRNWKNKKTRNRGTKKPRNKETKKRRFFLFSAQGIPYPSTYWLPLLHQTTLLENTLKNWGSGAGPRATAAGAVGQPQDSGQPPQNS